MNRLFCVLLSLIVGIHSQHATAKLYFEIYADELCAVPEQFSEDYWSLEEHTELCNELKAKNGSRILAESFCPMFQTSRGAVDCYFAYLEAVRQRIIQIEIFLDEQSRYLVDKLLEETQLYSRKVCDFESEAIVRRQMWKADDLAFSRATCQLPIYENLLRVIASVAGEGM